MFTFSKFRDYFIGDLLKDDHDTLQYANTLVVFYTIVTALCLLIPLQFFYLFIGNTTQQIIGLISIGVFVGSLILIKTRKSIVIIGHVMLVFSSFTFALNSFLYPGMSVINGVLLACNILFVFNLFNKRIGAIYSAFHVIAIIAYIILDDLHIQLPLIKPIVQELPERIISFSCLFILMVVLILHYQAAHKRSVVKLLKTIAALRKSEEQRKKSQAIGHIGNWEILLPSYASSMDEESYRIFGISEATVSLDEDFKNRVHAEDWEKLVLKMTPEVGKKYYEHEYRMRKPSGEEKIIHAIGELQVDKNGNPFKMYGIIQDITERKLAEEKQQKLLDITSFQNNKLKNFAYIVSHNIRSHSANITSLVDLLSKSKDVDERSRIQEMLKSTAGNLEETLLNLNEILTITENASLPKHKLQLVNEVQKTLEVLSGSICPKTTKVTVTIPEDIFIQAIPSYSDSILLNIISNAIKYRFPDRFSEIEISAKKLEDYVVLSVKDNGMGINLQKYGHKIFGMYKTFHNNADARGIGLFITKSHLEAMNGKIEVESEENIGTTFKIYFNEKD